MSRSVKPKGAVMPTASYVPVFGPSERSLMRTALRGLAETDTIPRRPSIALPTRRLRPHEAFARRVLVMRETGRL